MNWRVFFFVGVLVLFSTSLISAAGEVADTNTIEKIIEDRSAAKAAYDNPQSSNSGWFTNFVKTVGSYHPMIALQNWAVNLGKKLSENNQYNAVSPVPDKSIYDIKSDRDWKLATREVELADAKAALEKAKQEMYPAGEIKSLQEQYNFAENRVKDMQSQISSALGVDSSIPYSPERIDYLIKVGEAKAAYDDAVKNAESPEMVALKKSAADDAMSKYKDFVEGVNLYNNPPSNRPIVDSVIKDYLKEHPEDKSKFDVGAPGANGESGNGGVKVAGTGNVVYGYGR